MRGKNNWQRTESIFDKINLFIKKGKLQPWYWIYRFRWNYVPKLFYETSFPTEMIIEVSSLCNLKCLMCFRNYLPKETKYSNMEFKVFQKIINECRKEGIAAVKLSWRGESLLNKDFVKMVAYAKKAGIEEVSTLTNATCLTPEVAQGLIDKGLDQIIISVDGVTKETYEKVRRGANFERVITNINKLIELKNNKPLIRLQITEIPENKDEIQDFVKEWRGKVDEIAISGFIDYSYIDEEQDPKVQEGLKKAKGRLPCPSLWQRLAIMADGTVTVCCIDVQGKLALGNVKDRSIKSMWQSYTLHNLRKIHKARNLDSIEACRKCNARITYKF